MVGYLNNHTVIDTDNPERIRAVLIDVFDAKSFDLLDEQARFKSKAGAFNFGGCNLSYCSYGSTSKVAFRDQNYVRFQFAISGGGLAATSRTSAEVAPDVIISTPAETTLTFGHGFQQLVLRIDRMALQRDLAALLGVRPKQDIEFAASTDVGAGYAARFRSKILNQAASLDIGNEAIPAPLLREMDQIMRLKALYAIRNNFSDRLNAPQKDTSAWQVRQVEEWIDAHWREDVTIEKLVQVSGASARSIFATFRNSRGYGPMTYLKKVRLEAARQMLLTAPPGGSVTAIALACGFLNTGHFAKLYKTRFGELPSETRQNFML
ncbi:MAG: helix-turn-helix domain-containing protein [Rhodopseudomonas sp.]|nr:helix-turn-helix domain-containing protein [Rhodopseudomonas sp.]